MNEIVFFIKPLIIKIFAEVIFISASWNAKENSYKIDMNFLNYSENYIFSICKDSLQVLHPICMRKNFKFEMNILIYLTAVNSGKDCINIFIIPY